MAQHTYPSGSVPRPRRRWSLTTILLGGIGGLLTVAVAAVLAVGLLIAGSNTMNLLRQSAVDAMAALESLTLVHLEPAAINAATVAGMLEESDLVVDDRIIDRIRLTLKSAPQLRGVGIFLDTDEAIRIGRDDLLFRSGLHESGVHAEDMMEMLATHGVTWGEPSWSDELRETVVYARAPIVIEGKARGAVVTGITTKELSRYLDRLSRGVGTAFIVDEQDRVIAHPQLIHHDIRPIDHATDLPSVHELEDSVLISWFSGDSEQPDALQNLPRIEAELIATETGEYIVMTAPLPGLPGRAWQLGVAVPTAEADVFLDRIVAMAGVGGAVLVVTLILLYFLARAIRRPVGALALASDRIRRLDLLPPPELPVTAIRELNDAASAFDRMVAALKLFESYVPRRLVFRIMRDGSDEGLAARSRDVTVLFTDIPGFTTLSEQLDGTKVARLLNHHFTLVAGPVEETDGTIDKYIGDSVMAFWGAPARQEDHAGRALAAVRAIADAILADNAARRDRGEPPIRIRIGLHAGSALAGNIGAPGRINYTLIGDTVNAANRLEQLGKEIDPEAEVIALASADVLQAAGAPQERFTPVGERMLRGRSAAVTVYRIV